MCTRVLNTHFGLPKSPPHQLGLLFTAEPHFQWLGVVQRKGMKTAGCFCVVSVIWGLTCRSGCTVLSFHRQQAERLRCLLPAAAANTPSLGTRIPRETVVKMDEGEKRGKAGARGGLRALSAVGRQFLLFSLSTPGHGKGGED